jgi:hypothetical protein
MKKLRLRIGWLLFSPTPYKLKGAFTCRFLKPAFWLNEQKRDLFFFFFFKPKSLHVNAPP